MFAEIPERQFHRIRWVLTGGWLLLIISLFYDPISAWITTPTNTLSPLHIDTESCVKVQGTCLVESPYALGAPIFWGIIVPSAIFILLVFGHEFWRRICPLSFLSQIPRALGWQRQRKRVDAKTGKTRYELVKVAKNSWLARNYLYLQFGLFFVGLCSRILFVNSDRLALGIFLTVTILAAITVGYLYGGKSWCHYFCPMAPVQKIYAEPRGLLTSTAHQDDRQVITQSMCRAVNKDGKEQSACVACHSPCIDTDAERSYWDGITKPEQQLLYYGYVGLVVGYFVYYYLYAGNWNYYFSGIWAHQENQLATLLSPGFYWFERAIPIPKIVAVPMTLAAFTAGGYWLGRKLEKRFKAYQHRHRKPLSQELIRHRMFTLCTYFIFNVFFVFGGRPFIRLLPIPVQYLFTVLVAVTSTLWLYRTWQRSSNLYSQEGLANRLRKQLGKLNLDVSRFLEGRSLEDLNANEVYVLAKVLPGFSKEKRLQAYKSILQEALEEGYVNSGNSLEILQQVRRELDISEDEHQTVLMEIGVENPDLLDPRKRQSHEEWLRLESYREALLETVVESLKQHPDPRLAAELSNVISGKESIDQWLNHVSENGSEAAETIRREYGVTTEEEQKVLKQIDPNRLWKTISHTLDVLDRLDSVSISSTARSQTTTEPISDEQLALYQDTFRKFDKDGNGYLSAVELCSVLRTLGRSYSIERVQQLMDAITGRTKAESIGFEEFLVLLDNNSSNQNDDGLLERFRLFDVDGSGHISVEELRVCIRGIDPSITDDEIEEMLKLADTNSDREISYDEFRDLFQRLKAVH